MHTGSRLGLLSGALALLAAALPGASQAFPVVGVIDAADPTMPVVFISTPNCTGQGVSPVHYEVSRFYVTVPSNYILGVFNDGGIVSLYIHEGSFDPAASFATCIAASNSGGPLVSVPVVLQTGVQYFAVVFNDAFDQEQSLPYTLDVLGPGAQLGLVPPLIFRDGFESPSMAPRAGRRPSSP